MLKVKDIEKANELPIKAAQIKEPVENVVAFRRKADMKIMKLVKIGKSKLESYTRR